MKPHYVHLCDYLSCDAHRASTRLAVGKSSRTSVSRQAKRTANTLYFLDKRERFRNKSQVWIEPHFSQELQ